jgi:hypothetical protein
VGHRSGLLCPLDRSVGLLVGWTHLSGTAVNLVGAFPGVPMSHKPSSNVWAQRPREGHGEVLKLSTGQIACTSIQKKKEISLAADLFLVLPNIARLSGDL